MELNSDKLNQSQLNLNKLKIPLSSKKLNLIEQAIGNIKYIRTRRAESMMRKVRLTIITAK